MDIDELADSIYDNTGVQHRMISKFSTFLKRQFGQDYAENITLNGIHRLINRLELYMAMSNCEYSVTIEFNSYFTFGEASLKYLEGNILTYVVPLGIYQIFGSLEKYIAHINRLCGHKVCCKIEVYQLVLRTDSRKLMILCRNDEALIKKIISIEELTAKYTKVEVGDLVQITFEKIFVQNPEEECQIFEKLMRLVQDNSVKLPIKGTFVEGRINLYDGKIRDGEWQNKKMAKRLKKIEKYLKNMPNSLIINNDNSITISGDSNTVDVTTKLINKKPTQIKIVNESRSVEDVSREWLIANRPHDKEPKEEYYNRFIDETGQDIKSIPWYRIASSIYVTRRSGNFRYYDLKK